MSFSNQICWSFLPIFNQKADIFVRNIGQHVGKGDFDMLKYSAACTLDIVLGTDELFCSFSQNFVCAIEIEKSLFFRDGFGHNDEHTDRRKYALYESTHRVSYGITLTQFTLSIGFNVNYDKILQICWIYLL